MAVASAGAVAGVATTNVESAAFSIFFRFQIRDFNFLLGFFSLCHFCFPLLFRIWFVDDFPIRLAVSAARHLPIAIDLFGALVR